MVMSAPTQARPGNGRGQDGGRSGRGRRGGGRGRGRGRGRGLIIALPMDGSDSSRDSNSGNWRASGTQQRRGAGKSRTICLFLSGCRPSPG